MHSGQLRITNKLLKQILKTRSQLRGSATCCTIQEGCNYFQKIWKPPQNSLRQADVIKQVYSILMFIGR